MLSGNLLIKDSQTAILPQVACGTELWAINIDADLRLDTQTPWLRLVDFHLAEVGTLCWESSGVSRLEHGQVCQ